ncbi:fibronectin type III domain-containing protein [Flagellimonas sp.]|uniref:fibronectin type III domain-containing protein n=1 Tax=Flagellimonas sp. TaxID=2058762 RepID=UPI003F49EF78
MKKQLYWTIQIVLFSISSISFAQGGGTPWTDSNGDLVYTQGSVGFGTSAIPNEYRLAIQGGVLSEEAEVRLQSAWPDYVFEKDYELPSLKEVEDHIREYGHLINIPSAETVGKAGFDAGEMNRLLLEKVEELTLYVIQHNKRIENLEGNKEHIQKSKGEISLTPEKSTIQNTSFPFADIVWQEDFTGLANGATSDNGSTSWSSSITPSGTAEVQNGLFAFQGINGGSNATWVSEDIDISNHTNINISYLVGDAADGEKETSDYVRGYYVLDGGSRVQFANITDDIPTPQTQSITGLNGNTIRIEVDFRVSYGNETYNIDNIVVEGDLITPADTTPPSVPTSFSNGSITETSVSLNWAASSDDVGVVGYNVYQDGVLQAGGITTLNHVVTGLSAGTSYDFNVSAVDAAGNESSQSSVLSVSTASAPSGSLWTESGNNISYTSGNIGIGTTAIPSGYRLAVNGKILAEELKIQPQSQWPDYVFQSDYFLPSLKQVENYIKENGHLEDIPSAAEVEQNGIELGEMNKRLLEKIEQLTLYIISMDKTITKLEDKQSEK